MWKLEKRYQIPLEETIMALTGQAEMQAFLVAMAAAVEFSPRERGLTATLDTAFTDEDGLSRREVLQFKEVMNAYAEASRKQI